MSNIVKDKFRLGFIQMIDYLIESFPGDIQYIALRVFINDKTDIEKIITWYKDYIYPNAHLISEKKDVSMSNKADDFFSIKTDIPQDYLQIVRAKWTSNEMRTEVKERVWKYFDFFNKCIEKMK